nr:hypothetical protein BaRGS_014431 [Batillaria attramentaria]
MYVGGCDQVNCTEQNLQFADIIQAFLQPHFYQNIPRPRLPLVPFAANGGGNGDGQFAAGAPVDDEDGDADEGEEGDDDDNGLTIDLDDLPSILVDNSSETEYRWANDYPLPLTADLWANEDPGIWKTQVGVRLFNGTFMYRAFLKTATLRPLCQSESDFMWSSGEAVDEGQWGENEPHTNDLNARLTMREEDIRPMENISTLKVPEDERKI